MKKLDRIMSYVLAALAGCAVTLFCLRGVVQNYSKLQQVEYLIDNRFIGESDMDKAEDYAASAMIASLGDRWSFYLTAEEYAAYQEQLQNAYVGIGITISAEENGQGFLIVSVEKNGGAQSAGLLAGDIILSAAGSSTSGMTTEELRNLIRGEEGTSVQLEILRGEERLTFEIVRSQILTEVVSYQMLEDHIGLVTIRNFDERCSQEAIAAIEDLLAQGADCFLFDVRNNPGGYATELVALLDYLLPEGDLFRTVDYSGHEEVDKSDAACLDMPIAVVCNSESYSAAEFFPAAIQEYGAGTIVGTPTCGKGYFQYTYVLKDGSAVGLSVGKYYTPNGNSLIDVGIQPDVLVEVDDQTQVAIASGTLAPEDDPQIQAAVEVLRQQ